VKIGPATMSFRGEVEVRDIDPGQMSLALLAKGTDSTGTSGASMDLKARVEPAGDGLCNLVGNSEVSMSGKAAAFGGRMMSSVAEQLMQQFSANFAAQVAALFAHSAATSAAAAGEPGDAAAEVPPIVPPVASELNGLALAWAVLKDWLRSLFTRKTA